MWKAFGWFRRKPKSEPPTTYARLAAVLIDIPNVVNAWRDPKHAFRLARAWGAALRKRIARDTEGRHVILHHAFSSMDVQSSKQEGFIRNEERAWRMAGYNFLNNPNNDIDTILAIRMMNAVMRAMESHDRVHLRLILVSGDNIFAKVLQSLRDVYEERLVLEPVIYAWQNSMGTRLRLEAQPEHIRYLEEIEGMTE